MVTLFIIGLIVFAVKLMFGVSMVDERSREKMLSPFTEMGYIFAETGFFDKSVVGAFAQEYMTEKQIQMYNLVGNHISRFFMGRIAKGLGCREKLDAQPYANPAKSGK